MDLNETWRRIADDLSALGRLGGADLEQAVERLLPSLEPALRLRLVEAISATATGLNALLPALQVRTSVEGNQVTFHVESEPAASEVVGDLDARITLRLPEELKLRIEAAAEREGLSLNSWLVKVLSRSTGTALSITNPTISVGRQLRGRGRA